MIYQFNPEIYPCRVWVGVTPSIEEINEMFYFLTEENTLVEFTERNFPNRFIIASTYLVEDKKTGIVGSFISIYRKKQMDVKTIAHESSHVADYLCERFDIPCGISQYGEPRAYLVGWIADCIDKVIKDTKKNNNKHGEKRLDRE